MSGRLAESADLLAVAERRDAWHRYLRVLGPLDRIGYEDREPDEWQRLQAALAAVESRLKARTT